MLQCGGRGVTGVVVWVWAEIGCVFRDLEYRS